MLPSVRGLDGYAGAMLLEKTTPGECEIIVMTFWTSLEAIRGFAGADLERAVVTDEARSILTSFDPYVRHYDVALRDTIEEDL